MAVVDFLMALPGASLPFRDGCAVALQGIHDLILLAVVRIAKEECGIAIITSGHDQPEAMGYGHGYKVLPGTDISWNWSVMAP